MANDISMIAGRLRELRDIYGYTTAEVAASLGMPAEQYESYEADCEDIPISVLYHLANIYSVDMVEILTGDTPRISTFTVVPAGHGAELDRKDEYRIKSLAERFVGKMMEPMIVYLDPEDETPPLITHEGQEFNYVIDGEIHFLFEDKKLLLKKGDSVYFDPSHPHGQVAAGGKSAEFLAVIMEAKK